MSADAQMVFYLVAFICFVVAAVLNFMPRAWPVFFVSLGLASWVFVLFFSAMKAA